MAHATVTAEQGSDRAGINSSTEIPPPERGVQHHDNHATQPDMGGCVDGVEFLFAVVGIAGERRSVSLRWIVRAMGGIDYPGGAL